MNRVKCKNEAKKMIKGNIGFLLKPTIVILIISIIFGTNVGYELSLWDGTPLFSSNCELLISILLIPIYIGYIKYMIDFSEKKRDGLDVLYKKYKDSFVIITTYIIISVLLVLGYWCFIIPGIIFSLIFTFVPYILADGNFHNPMEVINESIMLTKNKLFDILLFYMSFIPWFILCGITMGFAFIYVIPYFQISLSLLYKQLKK